MAAAAIRQQVRNAMETATVQYIKREGSDSFRVWSEAGKLLFATRCYRTTEGLAGARTRLQAWAYQHGYRLLDHKGNVFYEPEQPEPSRRTWGRS